MKDDSSDLLGDAEIVELSRALGDDYAAYGLNPPPKAKEAFWEAFWEAFREGYRAGLARHARPRGTDRFERKWLQLRFQALVRGRAVSKDVTVDFLKFLDVPVCPITLMPLTHGKLKPSDWSIDRLNNNGAYATPNLAVISLHANRAKGAKGLDEVRKLSEREGPVGGLTPKEWARMAATMFAPCYAESGEGWPIRQVAPLQELSLRVHWQVFQDYLVQSAMGLNPSRVMPLPLFLERLPNNQLRSAVKIMTSLIRERSCSLASPFDVWFSDDLFNRYKVFHEFLCQCTDNDPLRVMKSSYINIPFSERLRAELRWETEGYLN